MGRQHNSAHYLSVTLMLTRGFAREWMTKLGTNETTDRSSPIGDKLTADYGHTKDTAWISMQPEDDSCVNIKMNKITDYELAKNRGEPSYEL
jgi:hypothetical protein